ncbi:hypothetical protein MMC26_001232 [Xylographa opegraphella]|nr:hypothetical protein [Xylographa opegraphella]
MAAASEDLLDLERQRKQLEDSVVRLRKSLQHWRTWEAEYEGLKEEILGIGNDPPIQNLNHVGADFGGELLTEAEIKRLFESTGGQQRSAAQVLSLLSRRVDYVQDNVKSIIKQLKAAEDKLYAIEVLIHPEERSDEGLPLTEIIEELDEDGNVIASSVLTPKESSKQVVEALRNAGVKNLPIPKQSEVVNPSLPGESAVQSSNKPPDADLESRGTETSTEGNDNWKSKSADSIRKPVETLTSQGKKVVSFAQDVKVDVLEKPTSSHLTTSEQTSPKSHDASIPKDAIPHTAEIVPDTQEADGYHGGLSTESPEDAALRRQMLQYSMNEVGAIVAEMDLEESDSMTDYSEEADEELGSETDEEEDQYGRTIRRVISDDYRKQMLELERKLNAQMLENVGPNPDIPTLQDFSRGNESVEANSEQQLSSGTEPNTTKPKKGVRFAESLDISEGPPQIANSQTLKNTSSASTPIADLIIERTPSDTAEASTTIPKKRQSKFKTTQENKNSKPANQNNPMNNSLSNASSVAHPPKSSQRPLPTGPLGLTLAATLVERPSAPSPSAAPPPDELDPALMQQSLTTEYHRMRNRMIQRSGGFLAHDDEEPASSPLEDPSQPVGKRVSLFKRARLG